MPRIRFIWTPAKAESNVRDHRVTFEEAQTAFGDPLQRVLLDDAKELRHILIGMSAFGRTLVVVHYVVERDLIRIISARKATKHEKRHYENEDEGE